MARFMRAIQFSLRNKLDRPDKPGDDGWNKKGAREIWRLFYSLSMGGLEPPIQRAKRHEKDGWPGQARP